MTCRSVHVAALFLLGAVLFITLNTVPVFSFDPSTVNSQQSTVNRVNH